MNVDHGWTSATKTPAATDGSRAMRERASSALDADLALQELGSDAVAQAYVTATVTVWDKDPAIAAERLALV